jgi:hypothetical protein
MTQSEIYTVGVLVVFFSRRLGVGARVDPCMLCVGVRCCCCCCWRRCSGVCREAAGAGERARTRVPHIASRMSGVSIPLSSVSEGWSLACLHAAGMRESDGE